MKAWVSSVQGSATAGKTPEQALTDFVPAETFKAYKMGRAKANIDVIYKEVQK